MAKGTKIWAELLKLEDLNDKKNGAKTDKAYKDALTKLKYKGDNFKKHLAPLLIWPGFLFKKKEKES